MKYVGSKNYLSKNRTAAYNIAIKYGFCGDCRCVHDNDEATSIIVNE